MLSLAALEIILSPGHGFSSHFFLVEWMATACCPVIDLSHLNEFVLHSPFIIVPVAPVLLSIREGNFLASIRPECCVSSVPALQDSWTLLVVAPISSGSQLVRGPVLLDCRLPSGVHLCCRGLWVGSVPRDSASRVLPAGWSLPPRRPWP